MENGHAEYKTIISISVSCNVCGQPMNFSVDDGAGICHQALSVYVAPCKSCSDHAEDS